MCVNKPHQICHQVYLMSKRETDFMCVCFEGHRRRKKQNIESDCTCCDCQLDLNILVIKPIQNASLTGNTINQLNPNSVKVLPSICVSFRPLWDHLTSITCCCYSDSDLRGILMILFGFDVPMWINISFYLFKPWKTDQKLKQELKNVFLYWEN